MTTTNLYETVTVRQHYSSTEMRWQADIEGEMELGTVLALALAAQGAGMPNSAAVSFRADGDSMRVQIEVRTRAVMPL